MNELRKAGGLSSKARIKVMKKTPKAQEMESCPAPLLNSDTQVKPQAGEGKDAEKNHDGKFLYEMCTASSTLV